MTVDPWQHMLYQIEPEYDNLKRIMEEGPRFKVELSHLRNNKYQIHITEENDLMTSGLNSLDKKCEWSADQLVSWPDCRRVAWDRWEFKNRNDAEKFRTLFTLKWAQ